MATIKQKRAVSKLMGNSGNVTKSMREAGYKEGTVNTPQRLTDSKGFKEEMKPILEQLEDKRKLAILALTGSKINKEKAKDLIDIIDKLTKNIQLLGGRATERKELLTSDQVNELLKRK